MQANAAAVSDRTTDSPAKRERKAARKSSANAEVKRGDAEL
jgi:hypothetical protein